ncbi:MAG: hypothetical protein Q9219_003981 [cf. Caloplaca sp. 3 TL-2023]
MRAILPGKPQAKLQAIFTARWQGLRLVAYISGNALVILKGPNDLLQTIYHDEGDTLLAVVLDENAGKIAAATSTGVYVYRAYGKEEGLLKWSLQLVIPHQEQERDLTLSWGTDEELLVGSGSLRLFQTAGEEVEIWSRKLPKPVKLATFSYDAGLIASTGRYDRLIKLWRRQSSGADDTRFDCSYLPHPTAVTSTHWRRPHVGEHASNHVLYSVCGDQKIRVWASMDPHSVQGLQLWAEIDMQASIQPRQPNSELQSQDRFAFIIDSQDFSRATTATVGKTCQSDAVHTLSKENHALVHLVEITKNNPDICVILDRLGHMSAWGLENVGCKVRKPTDVFNIAHVENFHLAFSKSATLNDQNLRIVNFDNERPHESFTLIAHHFDGRIEWLGCKPEELFNPSPQAKRICTRKLWTGHDASIKNIVRSPSGKAVISRANDSDALIWRQGIESSTFHLEGELTCLVQLPKATSNAALTYLAAMMTSKKGIVWVVQLPSSSQGKEHAQSTSKTSLKQLCTFDLDVKDEISFVLPVDPAGSAPWTSSSLDTFAKDVAISYSSEGRLRSWTAVVKNDERVVEWLVTATVDTSINEPSLASASSTRKAALVDALKNGLTIWDLRNGQLEHQERYGDVDTVQDLDWSSSPDEQALLCVGFPHKVIILAQMRYDYLDAGPAWAPIREIHIRDSTPHPIGDSTWLGSGNLLIGAGNQLFVYDKMIDSSDHMVSDLAITVHEQNRLNLFDLVTYLNGPLPLFHPQFLSQCILAGKTFQVQQIVRKLHDALRFSTDGDEVDSFVSLSPDEFFTEPQANIRTDQKSPTLGYSGEDELEIDLEDVAISLNENLTKISIPQLSSQEQMQLANTVECVSTVEKHRRSMDDNAIRYLLFFRQAMIRKRQIPLQKAGITYREVVWAYHSGSQDILVDLVSQQFHGRMLWEHARECGMFMWMTDLTALRVQLEVIARNEYTRTDEKNPIDCSLYYLALRKKNVLVGLWRMAGWNREQASTQRLLSNNFQEARWKTAALKNAYALLGRRRFEYAAAFFLLAGNLQDAVNVCLHQLRDLQLAVAIARVYEGDDGLVLRMLLEEKVLPQAAAEGNRWLATWAFWMLGKRDMAVRSLISPVHSLLDGGQIPTMEAKSYLANDPALVVLYKQLRGKTLQTLKGASRIAPKDEWDFVLRNARLYDRMGCDLLALDLVRNWEFLVQSKDVPKEEEVPDPRKLLRRRSSLVVDDLSSPKSPTRIKSGLGKPPAQKVFEEPEANSLLDNFGF